VSWPAKASAGGAISGALIVVGIVMAVALSHSRAEAFFAESGATLTKVRPVATVESVSVFDASINIEAKIALFYCRQFSGIERPRGANMEVSNAARWDYRMVDWPFSGWTYEGELFRHWPSINGHPAFHEKLMRRSGPQVFNMDLNLNSRSCGGLSDERKFFVWVKENISPQLAAGGISADYYLPKSEAREQPRYNHEPLGEHRQIYGVLRYQAVVYALLGIGIICLWFGINGFENGRRSFGIILALWGFFLVAYSGLATLSPRISEQF
jgi:hypothetical protein